MFAGRWKKKKKKSADEFKALAAHSGGRCLKERQAGSWQQQKRISKHGKYSLLLKYTCCDMLVRRFTVFIL